MKNKFDLINGTFSTKEALHILLDQFSSKIKFHQRDIFSKEERNLEGVKDSQNRIHELMESKEMISKILLSDDFNGKKVILKGVVTIEFED